MVKSGRNTKTKTQASIIRGQGGSSKQPLRSPAPQNFIQSVAFLIIGSGVTFSFMHDGNRTSRQVEAAKQIHPVSKATEPKSVRQILALTDAELEAIDIVELNLAVIREIPGHEDLDVAKYQQIVDGWADEIRKRLPEGERVFHQSPERWQNDIRFFRLGQMAGFLDQGIGIGYIDEQKQAQIEARKTGRRLEIRYTDPAELFLNGLIDTKRGTCGNMPTLHVAIGQRLGWPVSLAAVASHTVCRFDDGQVVYNIETTHTDMGGMFSAGTDENYIKKFNLPRRAIESGSDLQSMTARQMLGYFIALRARHFADTDQMELADRDYALARSLLPNHRRTYLGSMDAALAKASKLFHPNETGHPYGLARWLNAQMPRQQELDMDAHVVWVHRQNQINRSHIPPPTPQPWAPRPQTANQAYIQQSQPGFSHQYHPQGQAP